MNENYNTPGFVTLGFVTCLILYNWYVYSFIFIAYSYDSNPLISLIIKLSFHPIVFMLFWSYYRAIKSDPGYVQKDINIYFQNLDNIKEKAKKMQILKQNHFKKLKEQKKQKKSLSQQTQQKQNQFQNSNKQNEFSQIPHQILNENPDLEQQQNKDIDQDKNIQLDQDNESKKNNYQTVSQPIDEEKFDIVKEMSDISYCFKCDKIKPPRAHHCKECKKCVNRMDHHCPWVDNCVGEQNQKYFILFLLYATIATAFCWISIVSDYQFNNQTRILMVPKKYKLYVTMCASTTFALSLAIGFLFYFQIQIMFDNLTTVEWNSDEMKRKLPFKKSKIIDNVVDVLGSNKLHWLFPLKPIKEEHHEAYRFADLYNNNNSL